MTTAWHGRQAALRHLAWLVLGLVVWTGCGPLPAPLAPPPPAPISHGPNPTPATPKPSSDGLCPRASTLDLNALSQEISCLLARYIQLDTTNPPGNEILAARFLEQLLAQEGIRSRVVESEPGRANLIARLARSGAAGGKRRALVLMHHMDVVPASADEWSVPPLSGELKDGYLYGRGSIDNKGAGAMQLVAFLLLKRLAIPLEHDVILLGVADEESGGAHGARWLLEKHPDWFDDVGFVLNEGGAILDFGNGRHVYSVERAQKAPLWLKVTAQGQSGHGSSPAPDSAAHVLVRALARLAAHDFPIQVLPEVQEVFNARAQTMPAAERGRYTNLSQSLKDTKFREQFLKNPRDAALVRNTLAITQLKASDKENVISDQASAVLDLRLLPGQDAKSVMQRVSEVLAEPSLKLEPLLTWTSHTSPPDTPLFAAIQQLASQQHPQAPVTANVIGGFTDCNAFRAKGIVCYGFLPLLLPVTELVRIHGKDERIRVDSLAQGVSDLVELVRLLGQAQAAPRPSQAH